MDWKSFKNNQKFLVLFLEMPEKYLWRSSIYKNVTGSSSFSKVCPQFKKMINFLGQDLQTYS